MLVRHAFQVFTVLIQDWGFPSLVLGDFIVLQEATPLSHAHLVRTVTQLVYVGAKSVCHVLGVSIAMDLVSLNQRGSVKLGSSAGLGLLYLLRLMESQEMSVPGVVSALRAQQSKLTVQLGHTETLLGMEERRIVSHVTQGKCSSVMYIIHVRKSSPVALNRPTQSHNSDTASYLHAIQHV